MSALPRFWYHLTRRDRLAAIRRDGLRPGSPLLLTSDSTAARIPLYYGVRPIFVSQRPWMEERNYDLLGEYGDPDDFVLLRVDVAGLPLLADIPSLADVGMYFDEDGVWWGDDAGEFPLCRFEDPITESISFERLRSDRELIDAAIDWTKSAAIATHIAPSRIEVVTP